MVLLLEWNLYHGYAGVRKGVGIFRGESMSTQQKKVVIVTGAGNGIGKALTLHLLNEGYYIAAISRTEKHLTMLTTDAHKQGTTLDKLLVIEYDLNDLTTSKRLLTKPSKGLVSLMAS